MNRRDWLRACGRLAGGAAIRLSAPGCAAPPDQGEPPIEIDVAVTALPPRYLAATFDPREDSAIAWLCASSPTVAHVELLIEGELEPTRVEEVELTEAGGLVAAVRLGGLTPDTRYRHRAFFQGGGYGPWLRFRTAPEVDALAPLSFLFSGDVGIHPELEETYRVLAAERVPFYVHLGDWPYADQAPAARSIRDFRERHRLVREPYAIQEWLWSTPLVPIYDDHDIRENWAGKELAARDPQLLSNGLAVWREFFPLAGDTAFRDFRWGKLAHFFIVDTRLYRDRRHPLHEFWRLLGGPQLDWLSARLRESDAAFKILCTSVPFGFDGYEQDDWSSFPTDRGRVLRVVRERGIDPLIVLSADRHWFAARHLEDGVREYQVGPLTAGLGRYPDSFPANVVASALARNFGRIDIEADLERGVARLSFTCLRIDGSVIYSEDAEAPLPRV